MRIRFWIAAAIALGGATPAGAADAPYPDRPVRVFVGLAPGGGTDSVARVLAQKLAEVFRQTFVVDNRPGAGGNVAGEMAARSAPDGHTLIVVTPTHVVNPSLYRDVRYDALKDFTPICLLVHSQYYLSVANAVPAATVKELIALAKTRNPRLTYASSGIGSANHLSGALFTHMAGIEMTHVPYKGGAPALAALIAGEVQVSFTSSVAITQAKAGRLKTLAVTGAKRSPIAPDVPTIAESGVAGYEVTGWYGIVGAGENGEAHRPAPQHDHQPRAARAAGPLHGAGPGSRRRHSRGIRRAPEERAGKVGGRREADRRAGELRIGVRREVPILGPLRGLLGHFGLDQIDQPAHPRLADAVADEDHARAPVVRRPALEPDGRVIDVLHAVDHRRALGPFGDVDDALHAPAGRRRSSPPARQA